MADRGAEYAAAVSSLLPAIESARSDWQRVAIEIHQLEKDPDWENLKPAAELILYLTNLDYEIKVLVQRVHVDFDNRGVWEKYLGLALFEGITAVPKVVGRVVTDLVLKTGRESEQVARVRAAATLYNAAVRHIRADTDFWALLGRLRNETSAHHTGKGESLMATHSLWARSVGYATATGVVANESMISIYAAQFVLATRQLVRDSRVAGIQFADGS